MQDRELYRRILGIGAPWYVESVELKSAAGEIQVRLAHHDRAEWPCPECGTPCKLYDHQAERRWRHLDTCQYRTILHAQPPRCECEEHGVRVVQLPWAEPSSRFTALFEALAIEGLKEASQKAVAGRLGLSWDEIHGILERAVKRGLKRRQTGPARHVGIDEMAFRKGRQYLTLVSDLTRPRVLHVAEGRKQRSLEGFWGGLTQEQIRGIEAVAMDMWDPYIASVREHMPDAGSKIVFDQVHVARRLRNAVDQVRREENKTLKAAMRPEDRKERAELSDSGPKTARAWTLAEAAMALYGYVYARPARKHFRRWHGRAVRSRLQPMIEVARLLKYRFENIITYLRHRPADATSESIRTKIQWMIRAGRGFRSRRNFVQAIYFHCGGLDMTPEAPCHVAWFADSPD